MCTRRVVVGGRNGEGLGGHPTGPGRVEAGHPTGTQGRMARISEA